MTTSKFAVSLSLSELPEKSGLTPIMLRFRLDRQRELPLDGPAARLGKPHDDIGFERLGRCRHLVERDGEGRLAGLVGLRQVGKRNALGADVFVLLRLSAASRPNE